MMEILSDFIHDDNYGSGDPDLDCESQDAWIANTAITLEGIPVRRHWFYRKKIPFIANLSTSSREN